MNEDLEKPVITDIFKELLTEAYAYLVEQQKIVEQRYSIHAYERWYYDQETGLITFSNDDGPIVSIDYEEVGTISKSSETWLWSWANPHVDKKVCTDIIQVMHYGRDHQLPRLTKRKWLADEYDGWEMTAISAYLMKAKGAYRFPLDNTFSFVIYKSITDLRR